MHHHVCSRRGSGAAVALARPWAWCLLGHGAAVTQARPLVRGDRCEGINAPASTSCAPAGRISLRLVCRPLGAPNVSGDNGRARDSRVKVANDAAEVNAFETTVPSGLQQGGCSSHVHRPPAGRAAAALRGGRHLTHHATTKRDRRAALRLNLETDEPVLIDGQSRLTLGLGRGLEAAPGPGVSA